MGENTIRVKEVLSLLAIKEIASKFFRSIVVSPKIYLFSYLLSILVGVNSLRAQPVPLSSLNYQVAAVAYEHTTDCFEGTQDITFSVGAFSKSTQSSLGTTTGDNCITYTQNNGSTRTHADVRALLIARDRAPDFVELGWSAWNENNSLPTSDPCEFETFIFFPDDCDLDANTITRDPSTFPRNNWNSVIEQTNSSRLFVRYISRYAGGTQSRPLNLGTRNHQTFIDHINDNSSAPSSPRPADSDMGYFNFFDNTDFSVMNLSNDVHYVFTLPTNSFVSISTRFEETILNGKIALFEEGSGSELLISEPTNIRAHLPAGDYRIVVEGSTFNDHGRFKLGLFTSAITVDQLIVTNGRVKAA